MSRFRKRHTKVGASPGTLVISTEATPPKVHVMDYTESELEEQDVTNIADLAGSHDTDSVTWIDVQGLGDEKVLREIGEQFSLHPLALEDAVNVPQRPKAETYDEHLLLITRMTKLHEATLLETEQVSIFIGHHYVLTFQERYGDVFDPVRERIRRSGGLIRKNGADFLAYALLDAVIDAYYPILEQMGDFLEDLEEEVIDHPSVDSLQDIYRAKRELLTLRRSVWPQREMVHILIRDESEFISDNVRVYLRDTYDHCVQLIDVIETYRELAAGLMDVYLSSIGNRQNEVMKVLTIMASIFIPLTFLAGVYGMNFKHMPELDTNWGYPVLLAVMAGTALAMLAIFIRLGWIGLFSRPKPPDD